MSGRPRCVLHIGTMKTATTTIQAWLKNHETWLDGQGWTYPGWPFRGAARIARKLEKMPRGHNLIISDEGLWHFSGGRSDTAEIARILSDFDVTVLVYFRRPDQFLEAWFKQGIKSGTGEQDITRFLNNPAVGSKTMRMRLDSFAQIFGEKNLLVAPYEQAQLRGGGIIADFLSRTGLPAPQAVAGQVKNDGLRENVSPTADVILMAGLMRRVFQLGQSQIDILLGTPPCAPVSGARNRLLTTAEIDAIRADFRPAFAEIQRRFGGGTAPDFFLDWGEERNPAPISPLRQAYDQYMAALDAA